MNIFLNNLDTNSFEKLFKEQYTPLCNYCMQFVRSRAIAEDIIQDLFLTIWSKRNEIQIKSSIQSYLYSAVRNNSIHYLKNRFVTSDHTDLNELENKSNSYDQYADIEFKELDDMITKALQSLPEKCYVIFSMSRFGELTYQEISRKLNISVKTVETQMSIALKKIRLYLEKYHNL